VTNNITCLNANWSKQIVTSPRQIQTLVKQAMHKSIEVRKQATFDLKSPLCIYDLCDRLNVTVKFVEIGSMEGMYYKEEKPRILLSGLRPLPRRNFTCAHELGHHVFGHRLTIDDLVEDSEKKTFKPQEFLVDSFAGFLLMPTLGVRKAFASRGWNAASATPPQLFTIACAFGVGYETLISHITYTLQMISRSKANLLLKSKPKAIRQELLGYSSSDPLIIADANWAMSMPIDAEVGNLLLLPHTAEAENDTIVFQEEHRLGRLFRANRRGFVRVHCPNTSWAVFVRVSPYQYVGLSKHRHYPEVEDD
jgi:Zn-dependent peptidase ImmA (M78 family)